MRGETKEMAKRATGRTGKRRRPHASDEGSSDHVGKRVVLDRETFNALDVLMRDQMKDFSEIADEAFSDLLKKHGRTADFRTALKLSARAPGTASKPNRKSAKTGARRRASS